MVYRLYNTFEEGSAIDEVPPVRETWSPGTELGVLWGALLWTLVTFGAPGDAHRAAAGVHTVSPRDGSATALIVMGEVTLLRTQV